jgi:hypothetical protein
MLPRLLSAVMPFFGIQHAACESLGQDSACSQQARVPVLAMHAGTGAHGAAEGACTLRRVRKCPRILVSSGGWRTCAWHAHAGVPSRPSRRRASCRSAAHREGHETVRPAELVRLTLPPHDVQADAPACMYARGWVSRGSQKQSLVTHLPHKHLLLGVGGAQAPHQERAAVRVQGLVASECAHGTQRTARLMPSQHPTRSARQYISRPVRTRARHFARHASRLWEPPWSATQLTCKAWKNVCLALQGHLRHSRVRCSSTSATGVHGRPLCRLAGRVRCTSGSMERGPTLFSRMLPYQQAEAASQRVATAGELTAMASSSSCSAALCVSLSCSRPIAACRRSLRRCLAVGSSGPALGAAGAVGAGLPVPMACSVEARILCICGHNLEIYFSNNFMCGVLCENSWWPRLPGLLQRRCRRRDAKQIRATARAAPVARCSLCILPQLLLRPVKGACSSLLRQ